MDCSTDWETTRRIRFLVDGQPITDQQSKVFSNQIPLDAIHCRAAYSFASELYILQMNEFCK